MDMEMSQGGGDARDHYPSVTIYTSNDCHWCVKAKEYMAEREVPYIEKNVELDQATATEALNLAGQRQTPVLVVGSQVIVGFQRRELDALLGGSTRNG